MIYSLTWTHRAIIAGLLCAAYQPVVAQTQYVQPINWSRIGFVPGVPANDSFANELVGLLQNHSRYLLRWIDDYYDIDTESPEYPGVEYYYAFLNYNTYGYEQCVRPLSSFAYGLAVMMATGTYDPAIANMSEAEALHKVEMAIRGVAFSHRANRLSGLHWGGRTTTNESDKWEAALWASIAGDAAWLIWDRLSLTTQLTVAKMIEYEANSTMTYIVPYWRNPDGSTNYPGDTKAEENGWNAHLPVLAQAMMPNHPNAAVWRAKAAELQVSAYARQSDIVSTRMIEGKPVKDWIHGFNMYENGVAVNHNRVHPDYMISDFIRLTSIVTFSLAHQYVPESTFFNFDVVYSALTTVQFIVGPSPYSSGSIIAPGGTIYTRTPSGGYVGSVYYPQGSDWTMTLTDGYVNADIYAKYLGLDQGKNFDSLGWAQAHLDKLVQLQTRPGHDGNVYQDGDWVTPYQSTETLIFQSNAEAWTMYRLMSQGLVSPVSSTWGTLPTWRFVACDFDHDGDVDLDDYGRFQICRSGLGVIQYDPNCYGARLDNDPDVDHIDLARFLNCLSRSGPGKVLQGSDVTCAD